jgi:hypothetical protein
VSYGYLPVNSRKTEYRMMKEVDEQKRLKLEHQKLIDDAIKAGPYFNKRPKQLTEKPVIEITQTEVAEPELSQEVSSPSQASEITDLPSNTLEAA